MTPATFRSLRVSMEPGFRMSQDTAAKVLGVSRRTLQRIEEGWYGDPIPRKFELMILGHGKERGL